MRCFMMFPTQGLMFTEQKLLTLAYDHNYADHEDDVDRGHHHGLFILL